MSIQAIDVSSIHSLTSGQVVIDLQTAVKELVENALDAGATSIDVKFKEHGLESIEVQDNGKGIEQADWPGIALKHHTSKLASFADLASVSTLGFRGEALSSLCGTAQVSLVTSTASTAPIGTALTFERSGECVVGGKIARAKGTTIKVDKLFDNLPVRRKELQKNAKREFGKALELLQAYALISTGVRFEVKNITKSRTMTHLQSPASPSLRSNFSSIFAPKSLQMMMDLALELEVAADKSVLRWTEGSASATTVKVKGLVSRPSAGNGRTSGNRQFFYINGRPFHPTKIAKAINEVYKSFVPGSFPSLVVDFQLAPDAYDVNVSPDKRTIFLHSEGNLIAALKTALEEFYQPSQSTFEMTSIGSRPERSETISNGSAESHSHVQERQGAEEPPRKKKKLNTDGLPLDTGRESAGTEEDHLATSSSTNGLLDDSIDMEIDAQMFVSTPSTSPTIGSREAAIWEESDQSFELPIPPSPIRRAAELARVSRASSPPALHSQVGNDAPLLFGSPDTEQSPIQGGSSTSETTMCGEEPKSPVPRISNKPLFRSSPSPSPFSPEEQQPCSGTLSRAASPPSPQPPSIQSRLRQPQLAFASTSSSISVDAKNGRKGKAKARQDGRESVSNLLQTFVRPGASIASHESNPWRGDRFQRKDKPACSSDDENGTDDEPSRSNYGSDNGERFVNRLQEDARRDSEDEAKVLDGGDEVEVVEDSFRAGSHSQETHEEAEDDLEFVSASCVCVHGSPPLDESDEGDQAPDEEDESSTHQVSEVMAPFGGTPAEIAGTFVAADTMLELDLSAIETVWSSRASTEVALSRHCEGSPALITSECQDELLGAGLEQPDDAAEATLSRVVSKDDFEAMEVVGQFNLGFIIARRRVNATEEHRADLHDDLFIIDQHASDEKYNFEKLQAETVIQSQRLLAPRVLNLPSHDEITAIEHLDLLRLNGYDVVVDEDADVGERVKLLAQPVSNKTVFDIADFEELLDLIGSRAGSEVVRPSKTRKMFASRACRKSVMIGKALNKNQMTLLIRHMGEMDQPWACPHGRPTMRWLAGLGSVSKPDSRSNLNSILEAYDRETPLSL